MILLDSRFSVIFLQVTSSYPGDMHMSLLKEEKIYFPSTRVKVFSCGELCQQTDHCYLFCLKGKTFEPKKQY